MTSITGIDSAVYTAYLVIMLSAVTWVVLWNARSRSVDLWVASNISSGAFPLLAAGTQAWWTWPPVVSYPLLATVGMTSVCLRVQALALLADRRLDWRVLSGLLVLVDVAAVALAVVPRGRVAFSALLLFAMLAMLAWSSRLAWQLGRRMQLLNARLLGLTLGVPTLLGSLAWAGGLALGEDLLLVNSDPVPAPMAAFNALVSTCNSALYIGVVLDLFARRTHAAQAALAAAEIERSRLEERARLVDDLHDGFGSQLTSARLSAERGELAQPALVKLLQECLADLHLVVDTMHNPDGRIGDALRFLRHRMRGRMAGHPTSLHWDIDVDAAPALPHERIIQVLRIVQEALANALRHAQATNIWVTADCRDPGHLSIFVRDDGTGMPSHLVEGNGLRSMRTRAIAVGGTLDVTTTGQGTVVALRIPHAA